MLNLRLEVQYTIAIIYEWLTIKLSCKCVLDISLKFEQNFSWHYLLLGRHPCRQLYTCDTKQTNYKHLLAYKTVTYRQLSAADDIWLDSSQRTSILYFESFVVDETPLIGAVRVSLVRPTEILLNITHCSLDVTISALYAKFLTCNTIQSQCSAILL